MPTPYPIRYPKSAFDDYKKIINQVNFQDFYKWKTGKKSINEDQFVIKFTHFPFPNNQKDKVHVEVIFIQLATIDQSQYLNETKQIYEAVDNENKSQLKINI